MFLALIVQLFNLTIIHGEEYTAQSQTRKRRSITLTGERGTIYDVNGVPLAYDQKSYDVEFYKDPEKSASSDRAYYTDIILETIDIIEKNGGEVIDTFNIKKDENGEFYFDFGIEDETAKARREENWRTTTWYRAQRPVAE